MKNKPSSFLLGSLLSFVLLLVLSSCDRYVPPSPFDGIWKVVAYEKQDGATDVSLPKIDPKRPEYWRFSNLLFQYDGGATPFLQGYVMVKQDRLHLTRIDVDGHDFSKVPWPLPDGSLETELVFRYRVWKGKLTLETERYRIHLERK